MSLLKPFYGLAIFKDSVNLRVTSSKIQNPNVHLPILNNRTVIIEKGQLKTQVLVKWERLPVEESSWENLFFLKDKFLQLNLEDHVGFHRDKNDTNIPAAKECVKIVEDETEKKNEDVRRSTRLRKSPA